MKRIVFAASDHSETRTESYEDSAIVPTSFYADDKWWHRIATVHAAQPIPTPKTTLRLFAQRGSERVKGRLTFAGVVRRVGEATT